MRRNQDAIDDEANHSKRVAAARAKRKAARAHMTPKEAEADILQEAKENEARVTERSRSKLQHAEAALFVACANNESGDTVVFASDESDVELHKLCVQRFSVFVCLVIILPGFVSYLLLPPPCLQTMNRLDDVYKLVPDKATALLG